MLQILLKDSGKLQEEEAKFARKKGYSRHADPQPLYSLKDAIRALDLVKTIDLNEPYEILKEIEFTFHNAGHILGAAIIELDLKGESQHKKIVFSGDLGRSKDPILYPPANITNADILFVESTYGNKILPDDALKKFEDTINTSMLKGGCLLIPAFAVGRTQLLLYYLKKLRLENKIPSIPIYIDSPMAIDVTSIYGKNPEQHKGIDASTFSHENIHLIQEQEQSKRINEIKSGAIIISASGMCTGGRIMHHLYHRLQNENDTVLFVGFQAEGTRGRRILDGEETIKLFGLEIPVKCHIEQIDGFSAHADKNELLDWLSNFEKSPKLTFVVHGEQRTSEVFSKTIQQNLDWKNVVVPHYLESFELFENI